MSETQQPPQTKTYRGNCHCGAFVYEATIPEIQKLFSCACSICSKKGYLWTAVPDPDADFKVVKGDEDALSVYRFGTRNRHHKFCPTCGSAVLARMPSAPPGKTLVLNVRCVQDVDIWSIPVVDIHVGDPNYTYEPPQYKGAEPVSEADPSRTYHGSCHCGDVTVAVKVHPLDENYPGRIVECNCSICQRNGYIWIYPKPEEVVVNGQDSIAKYAMGRKILAKTFCKKCGIPISNIPNDFTEAEIAALPQDSKEWLDRIRLVTPINVRLFNDFDVKALKTKRLDGANIVEPKNVNP